MNMRYLGFEILSYQVNGFWRVKVLRDGEKEYCFVPGDHETMLQSHYAAILFIDTDRGI